MPDMGMTTTGQGRPWFQATSGQRYRRISCKPFIHPLPPLRIIHPLRWLLQAWLLQAHAQYDLDSIAASAHLLFDTRGKISGDSVYPL